MVEEKLIQIPITIALDIDDTTGAAHTLDVYDGSNSGKLFKITNFVICTNTENIIYQVEIDGVLFPAKPVTVAAETIHNVLKDNLYNMVDYDTSGNASLIIDGGATVKVYVTSIHEPHDSTLLFSALLQDDGE